MGGRHKLDFFSKQGEYLLLLKWILNYDYQQTVYQINKLQINANIYIPNRDPETVQFPINVSPLPHPRLCTLINHHHKKHRSSRLPKATQRTNSISIISLSLALAPRSCCWLVGEYSTIYIGRADVV